MKILVLIIVFMQFSLGVPKSIQKKIDKEVLAVFDLKSFSKKSLLFDNKEYNNLLVPFKENNFFEIYNDESRVGFYYFGSALGKTNEFDFVVIFDQELIIKKIKVLAYREDYGMEIGSKRWLNQFADLKKGDRVVYQKDIQAISGATISARSMTKAINNLLQSLSIIQIKKSI